MKTLLVTGDRNWTDRATIKRGLLLHAARGTSGQTAVIHGGARGADTIAGQIAKEAGWEVIEVKAEWGRYGRGAGPIRNHKMLNMHPDIVLAFHDDLEKSKGTKHCVEEAIQRGFVVVLFKSERSK